MLFGLTAVETLVETLNTSTGINQLLLAREERVALGADFNGDILLRGKNLHNIAAVAGDGGLFAYGMDAFLHDFHLFQIVIGRYCNIAARPITVRKVVLWISRSIIIAYA